MHRDLSSWCRPMRLAALIDLVVSALFSSVSDCCLESTHRSRFALSTFTNVYDKWMASDNLAGQDIYNLAGQYRNKIVDGKRQAADRRHGNLTVHDCTVTLQCAICMGRRHREVHYICCGHYYTCTLSIGIRRSFGPEIVRPTQNQAAQISMKTLRFQCGGVPPNSMDAFLSDALCQLVVPTRVLAK